MYVLSQCTWFLKVESSGTVTTKKALVASVNKYDGTHLPEHV